MKSPKDSNTRPISTYSFTAVATEDGYEPEVDQSHSADDECGIACFKPKWIQMFSKPIAFLVVFGLVGLIQGMFFTYYIGVITTLEKRYAFRSKVTGIISIADNLSPVLMSLVVGFFGGRGHKTKWIAVGAFVSAISAFISSMPYLIFGESKHLLEQNVNNITILNSKNMGFQMCKVNATSTNCSDEENNGRNSETFFAILLLFVGNFINGIGSTAFYIVGTPYLDDNINKLKAPIYFAVILSIRLLGPSLGFLLSSTFLSLYENPKIQPDFNKSDPRWVGAWWIGFQMIGTLLLISSFILLLFPKKLKWATDKAKAQIPDQDKQPSMKEQLKIFPKAVGALMKNPILMFQNMSLVFYILGVLGYILFLPKYFESHFRQPAHKSNILSGLTTIALMVVGFLISGFIIYKFKPSARTLSAWNVILGLTSVGTMIGLSQIGCEHVPVITNGYCEDGCNCNEQIFSPVCSETNMTTYFSPCAAGCTNSYLVDKKRVFDECTCTDDVLETGHCDNNCNAMLIYIILLAADRLLGSTGRIGNSLITLRCVSPEDKSLALSTASLFLSLFALIPYPLIYGAIVDSTCLVWETTCGKTGNCWIYDQDAFRIRFHGFTAICFAFGLLFDCGVWYYSKNIKSLYEDPAPKQKTKKIKFKSQSTHNDAIRYNWAGSKNSLSGIN